jgi:hypothetical protein
MEFISPGNLLMHLTLAIHKVISRSDSYVDSYIKTLQTIFSLEIEVSEGRRADLIAFRWADFPVVCLLSMNFTGAMDSLSL